MKKIENKTNLSRASHPFFNIYFKNIFEKFLEKISYY